MKKYIAMLLFFGIIITFDIIFFLTPDKKISKDERRYLTQRPTFSMEILQSGSYPDELETYLSDQFPFREELRRLHSVLNLSVFQKMANNDIVISNGSAVKIEAAYPYDSVRKTIQKMNTLKKTCFSENSCYFALIPDKSCYLTDSIYPSVDYHRIHDMLKEELEDIHTISLIEHLSLKDYYRTDSHWNQLNLLVIGQLLKEKMGASTDTPKYRIEEIPDFYGVYHAQAALNTKPDTLSYYTNDLLESCTVYHYDTEATTGIYDLEKLTDPSSLDMYDIFLSGATPLLKIENPSQDVQKTLIIFRDSFGSSLTPLLVNAYSEIYLIDLRYIHMDYVKEYLDITADADVLFLYSTLLVNTPENIRID